MTPGGQYLFDTDHPYNAGASTFRNVLGGSYGTLDDNLSATSLQNALDIHKLELKTQRGYNTIIPEAYTLIIPRALEATAGGIINSPTQVAGMYAGTGSNSSLVNTFYFDNNKIKFVVNPFIGMVTQEKGTIGATTNWFLANTELLKDQKALRYSVLNEGEFEMWYDEHTKQRYASYYHACSFDHYGAEVGLVGSQGTA